MPVGWQPEESGFTLIEVLISTLILGFIISGVAASIILFFRTVDGTNSRLSLSHDSQLLANYLIPDLDSLTSGQPLATPPHSPPCSGTTATFTALTLRYRDRAGQAYAADYTVHGSDLVRSFHPDLQPPTSTTTVIHNLKPGSACFTMSSTPPWTMTVTVEADRDPTTDYTFSVTGGGRVTTPTLRGPPKLLSAVSKDTTRDGRIDQIVVTFDQPLKVDDAAGITQWDVHNAGGAALTGPPLVSDTGVTLFLAGATGVDTSLPDLEVKLTAAANGIRNGADEAVATFSASVSDGMAPMPISAHSRDNGESGIDEIVVTFSEDLGTGPTPPENSPWQLSGATFSPAPPTVSGRTAVLHITPPDPFDTIGAALRIGLAFDPAGIVDLAGNVAMFGPRLISISDRAAPVPVSVVSEDRNGNGKVDHVVVTFSEALRADRADTAPWSLVQAPAGVTVNSVDVSGTAATLSLNEGTDQDTAAAGFQVALAADQSGIRDQAGNPSAFGAHPVTDRMGPVVTHLSSATVNGGSPGRMEPGDILTLTFSESLAATSVPSTTVVKLLHPSGGNDVLMIDGLATIDLGTTLNTSPATFDATLMRDNEQEVTVLLNVQVDNNPKNPPVTVGPTITVTPPATVTDVVGNPADGHLDTGVATLF